MPHQIMRDTVSVRTTVTALREKKITDHSTLFIVLMKNETDERMYYSIASALMPCTDMAQDICIVHDITGSTARAEELFRMIADSDVCPCTLEDILSDLL